MPPKGSKIARYDRESSIEHTPEYDKFIETLKAYHEKRGTEFDPEPRIGARHVDLQKLYERITGEGGYDSVSDTKARPLMWRKFAEEFIGKGPYLAAQAFQVKSAYYKNLAAYEISEHWKEEPPPKEILEDLTAKGGGIRGRTMENYAPRTSRESDRQGDDSGSDEESPKGNGDDLAATGRSSRGLRQAPPQRVLFQPDVQSARQPRATSSAQRTSPSPGFHAMTGLTPITVTPTNTTLASYEPRQQAPMLLRPVNTPANNPEYYKLKRKLLEDASAPAFAKKLKGLMLPGTGFVGPNIYVRAQLALQSGIPDEERFALHHLVKISHERGDKYRFDQFPGLAEALVTKALDVSGLFYNVDWQIRYDGAPDDGSNNILNGLRGTSDVLDKLKSNLRLDISDAVQSQHFHDELNRTTEATLIVRNMVMLEENAQYISRLPLFRDFATIVMELDHPCLAELQHYTLEIIEQMAPSFHLDSSHPLYSALLRQIGGIDRGQIVCALRATARLGMRFRENKRLEHVPASVLRNVIDWLNLPDEELRSACLDFLFQFSSISRNVDFLLRELDLPKLINRLSSFLLFEAEKRPYNARPQDEQVREAVPTKVPRLARKLVEQLLDYPEPERSSHWLRMCFQDDSNAEMTQIDLWKSYQGTFLPFAASHPHLIAGDFIKNVSSTFNGASAQVAGANKYVIRGIKPRRVPVNYKGHELFRCQWRVTRPPLQPNVPLPIFAYEDSTECGEFYPNGGALHEHILVHHLQIPRKRLTPGAEALPVPPSGKLFGTFDFSAGSKDKESSCAWSTCQHSTPADISQGSLRLVLLARHVGTHLPEDGDSSHIQQQSAKSKRSGKDSGHEIGQYWLNTATDEFGKDPTGLPLGAVLCLRNILRGLAKMPDEGEAVEQLLTIIGITAAEKSAIVMDVEQERKDATQLTPIDPELGMDTTVEGHGQEQSPVRLAPLSSKAVLIRTVFGGIRTKLLYVLGHNRVLKDHVAEVLRLLARTE